MEIGWRGLLDAGAFAVVVAAYAALHAAAYYGATTIKRHHVRYQNGLLGRCRGIYLLSVQALSNGEVELAASNLRQIRELETAWQLGRSFKRRTALAVLGACTGSFAYAGAALCFWAAMRCSDRPSLDCVCDGFLIDILPFLLASGLCLGAMHYREWPASYEIDDCGIRLEQLLNSPREIELHANRSRCNNSNLDGLSPHQVFGLPTQFSRSQLDAARRRMARQYHPDRWRHAGQAATTAADETMKRINAAYDQIKLLAS